MKMKIFCIMLGIAFQLDVFGQISFVEDNKISFKKEHFLNNQVQLYDSLTNICAINGSYKHLIGQDVVFYGNPNIEEANEKYGFGFYSENAWLKYLKSMNAGKVKIIEKLPFVSFLKKKFEILNIDTIIFKKKTYSVTKRFMKLKDTQSGAIAFYRFDDSFVNSLWSVVGYVEKAKQLYGGKYLMFEKNEYNTDSYLFYSSPVDIPKGQWKCKDVSLKISEFANKSNVVLKLLNVNNSSDSCYEYLDVLKAKYIVKVFSLAELNSISKKLDKRVQDSIRMEYLEKLYGKEKALDIFDGNVRLGFTQAMCREAWGSPSSRNITQGSWGIHEQWVYSHRKSYLYFENGVLTAIQY